MADDWRTSRLKRLQVAAIAGLGYPLVKVLGHTLRWRVEGLHHFEALVGAGRAPVVGFWHARILPATFYFRHRGIVVITSQNFDGEWIARIIERFGYGTARGSTSRGGGGAMLQLARAIARGRPVAFTVDGPRGPARVVQPGAVWLAKATGHPVLPCHLEAGAAWTIDSWDRAQIPKPFSTVALLMGAPMEVARESSAQQLEAARAELQRRLVALEDRARQLLAQ